jgi:hypothetical protein
VNPAATETCDGVDEDCDGTIDNGAASVTFYADVDGDGYGDPLNTVAACAAPSGYTSDSSDCDDTDASTSPAATESCDTIDNDCDGSIDNGGVCPCTVDEYAGTAYMFCNTLTSWSKARTACLKYGYDLVEVDDSAEQSFINTDAAAISATYWWIGLSDASTEGTYAWSTGAALSYTNWGTSEPRNTTSVDCVGSRTSKNAWYVRKCGSARPYICEG